MNVQVLFLLFTCVKIIKGKDTDSDEAKYIDLLPEGEKQDFLNKIAQRILAEIKSQSRSDRTSVEISDERLDEHSSYVQKIMEEETQYFKHKRRLGSQSTDDNVGNDNTGELPEKTLEKENILGQDKSDNIDITALKNNIRIKKDTYEDSNQTPIESRRVNSEDLGTEIPVPLLYDDESKVTSKNVFTDEEVVKEHLMENKLEVEGLSNKSDENDQNSQVIDNHKETTGSQFQNENSKEIINAHTLEDTRNSYADYVDTKTEATSDFLRTVIDDFEPKENFSKEASNINKTSKDTFIKIKSNHLAQGVVEKKLDLSKGELFVVDVKGSTDIINITPKLHLTEEDVIPRRINDTLKIISQKHTYASRPILRSEVNSSETNIENYTVNLNNMEEFDGNVHKTDDIERNVSTNVKRDSSEIILATSNIGQENYTSYHYNSITTENAIEEKRKTRENQSNLKQALRHGNEDMEDSKYIFSEKYPLKYPNFLPPSTENYNSHYRVFEVSNKNSPFVPSEQVNSEFVEEPHYVPVYNYDPTNAFYTGYNYFGPNFEENDKTSEININDNKVNKQLNDQNIIPDNIKSVAEKQNENIFNNHRNFKFYNKNQGNYKPRSTVYQKYLSPAWKGGFSDISFNPNDYLDMDYYLGRTNDVPNSMYDDFIYGKPQSLFLQQLRQDKSEDVIDPDASVEQYNIKDKIAALRNTLYTHKYGKTAKVVNRYNNVKNKLKTKFTKWKQNLDPILRGLDDTFLIFLPGGKAGGRGAYDDKNIAVDYYFSRMNSEELPLADSNETYIKPFAEKPTTKVEKEDIVKNIRALKKAKEKKGKAIKEKRIQIPFNPDKILKIDLAVQNGNKVNIIFRNVKKPELNKFDAYLNSYINVMTDMIEHDNKGLLLYDWLGSTVDIQSALKKLLELTNVLQAQEKLHYSDFELIKYILYAFQSSNNLLNQATEGNSGYNKKGKNKEEFKKRKVTTPRVVSNKKSGNLDQSLTTLRKIYEDIIEIQQMSVAMSGHVLVEFEIFLLDLQLSLNKLHESVKEIATITKFNKQNWFHDLKDLYLTPVDRNVSLSLLLHLATSKLFGIIEDGAKDGLEDNFIIFVQNHRAEVERTREEFIFVLRLLKAIQKAES